MASEQNPWPYLRPSEAESTFQFNLQVSRYSFWEVVLQAAPKWCSVALMDYKPKSITFVGRVWNLELLPLWWCSSFCKAWISGLIWENFYSSWFSSWLWTFSRIYASNNTPNQHVSLRNHVLFAGVGPVCSSYPHCPFSGEFNVPPLPVICI